MNFSLKRYGIGRKVIRVAVTTVLAAGFAAAGLLATSSVISSRGEENLDIVTVESGYVALVNGEEVAAASEAESLQLAFIEAKSEMSVQLSFEDPELEIVEKSVASTDMEENGTVLKDKMEQAILSTSECEEYRYELTVGETSFGLKTDAEVEQVLETVLLAKPGCDEYEAKVACVEEQEGVLSIYIVAESSYASVKAAGTLSESDQVILLGDRAVSLAFQESVQVEKIPESSVELISPEEAVSTLLGENAQPEVYTVQKGDCLSSIASDCGMTIDELLAMNPDVTTKTILRVGQEFKIASDKSLLHVLATVRYTVEEEIPYETEYITNDEWLETVSETVTEGENGKKSCVYEDTLLDGEIIASELTDEMVTKEAVNKVIEKGTRESGTYIYPVNAIITSYYGIRWEKMHKGIDFGVSVGTAVKASRSGTVIRASWYSGFGNCVEIRHSDGTVTRYAHLSEYAVSVGDKVSQGDIIAYSGNTGNTTGPHLHFEILIGGVQVDPLNYLSR